MNTLFIFYHLKMQGNQSSFLCFTWYLGEQKFCATTDLSHEQEKAKKPANRLAKFFTGEGCTLGEFVTLIKNKANSLKTSILVINTIGDSSHKSELHVDLFGTELEGSNYEGLHTVDYSAHGYHITTSVLIRRDLRRMYGEGDAAITKRMGKSHFTYSNAHSKVKIVSQVIFIKHPIYGSTGIVSVKIDRPPFFVDSNQESINVGHANMLLQEALNKFIKGRNVRPNRYIILGDFASYAGSNDLDKISAYLSVDELRRSVNEGKILANEVDKTSMKPLKEGVDDSGFTFLPTGDFKVEDGQRYEVGDHLVKNRYSLISWKDRILYGTNYFPNEINSPTLHLKCINYDIFDDVSMTGSPRAGVTATFALVSE